MENIDLYKEITKTIIKCIEDDNISDLEIYFEKRQEILDKEQNNEKFRVSMVKLGIIELDKTIKELLN